MTSHPPGRCCTVGVRHEGEVKGELKEVGGISTYVTFPEDKSTELAVLIIPDVMGNKFNNVQLIADQFAANGYLTVIPDIFEGDNLTPNRPPGFDLANWLKNGRGGKGHGADQVDPIVETLIRELKSTYGVKKIGSVGYCFGAKYVARFMAAGKGIDVGAFAHPSWVGEAELKGIAGPLTIAAAEIDSIFPAEKRHQTEAILNTMSIPWQINLYSGVQHGYSVRGDTSKPIVKYAKEATFLQHVEWFDEHLKGKRASAA